MPESDFDLSVVVSDAVSWEGVEHAVLRSHRLVSATTYQGEYRGSWVPEGHQSLTLRVTRSTTWVPLAHPGRSRA